VGEIADLVLHGLGKPESRRVEVSDRPGQVDRHIGSTEKAARLLGWRARTSFEDGLERTIAWYAENRAWWQAVLAEGARAYSA
jgi:dTDP-glucose 4,6-dehydratase